MRRILDKVNAGGDPGLRGGCGLHRAQTGVQRIAGGGLTSPGRSAGGWQALQDIADNWRRQQTGLESARDGLAARIGPGCRVLGGHQRDDGGGKIGAGLRLGQLRQDRRGGVQQAVIARWRTVPAAPGGGAHRAEKPFITGAGLQSEFGGQAGGVGLFDGDKAQGAQFQPIADVLGRRVATANDGAGLLGLAGGEIGGLRAGLHAGAGVEVGGVGENVGELGKGADLGKSREAGVLGCGFVGVRAERGWAGARANAQRDASQSRRGKADRQSGESGFDLGGGRLAPQRRWQQRQALRAGGNAPGIKLSEVADDFQRRLLRGGGRGEQGGRGGERFKSAERCLEFQG